MTIETAAERVRLEQVAEDSWYASGVNGAMIRYLTKVLDRHWAGTSCLELGPAEGLMTDRLAERFDELVLVDGSAHFCAQLRERFPTATVACTLFEDFEPGRTFDTVILGHILEHVDDPAALVARAAAWLAPGGRMLAAVPNARSLHRQAAVLMGMLAEEHALNATDIHHGHRRVFDPESFRALFTAGDLRLDHFGGFWLKTLSNAQIDATWTPEMIDAYFAIGERYPDVAAEIYAVARLA